MSKGPTKLKIEVLKDLSGESKKPLATFYASFNPSEYSVTKGAQIAEIGIPGLDSPILQFVRGTTEEISFRLFFDTTEDGKDVREISENFYNLVKINSDLHAPPVCRLSWGEAMGGTVGKAAVLKINQENKFRGIVTNVSQNFTLFSSSGVPLRAEMDITFKEYKTLDQQIRELNLKSSDHTKIVKIQRGDSLSSIAAKAYNDPAKWREIADKNNIYDPKSIRPGLELVIPPLE